MVAFRDPTTGRFLKGGRLPGAGTANPFIWMKLDGVEKVQGSIKRLQVRAPELAAKVMRTSAIEVVVPLIREQIRKNRSRFTGELHNRMTARSGVDRGTPFVDIGAFGVPYGLEVEKGRGPHTPDIDRIKEYVAKKMEFEGAMADSVAASIVRTLESVGSKPHPYLIPVWRASSGRFFADFVRRMQVHLAKGA